MPYLRKMGITGQLLHNTKVDPTFMVKVL